MSFHGGLLGVVVGERPVRAPARAPSSRSATRSPAPRRSACSSGGSPISSTASCGAGSPTCPGRWSSRAAAAEPRHPSQLYEAVLEGLVLFAVMCVARPRAARARRRGPPDGRLPDRLRPRARRRRAVPRAGRPPRLPARRPDHGPAVSVPMVMAGLALVAWSYRGARPSSLERS